MTYSYWKDNSASIPISNPASVRVGGLYYIKAENGLGCSVITALRADITLPDIVIPNTFTPNGDGINDVLTVLLDSRINIKSFRIYSRWGQPVFSTADINNFWDGNKGDTNVPAGTYFWFLEGIENSKKYIRYGSVTIIK
jgi:gliding motility-associated-like protein